MPDLRPWPADNVERWELARIKPYPRNVRSHSPEQIEQIAASMQRFGVTAPVLVDEEGVLIYGHGRLAAAELLAYRELPVAIARGWSEDEKAAYRIADNQLSLLSSWDYPALKAEMIELMQSGFDMPLLGFPASEIRQITANPSSADPDAIVPEPPANPVTRPGDVWICGDHRLMCGDATSPEDVEELFRGARPHLMVTDPPYGVNYDPNWRNEPEKLKLVSTTAFAKKTKAIGKVLNDDRADWREAWALFPGDVAYVWCGERQSVSMHAQLESAGLIGRNLIVWAKTHLVISRGHYHPQHETCWYAVRKGKTAHWVGDRSQSTLWLIPNLRIFGREDENQETGHGTQKPLECMRRPIVNNSNAGDLVYDPFGGSGTTMIAAELLARKALLMEIDSGYVDVIVKRWQAISRKEAILERTGRSFASAMGGQSHTSEASRTNGIGDSAPSIASRSPDIGVVA